MTYFKNILVNVDTAAADQHALVRAADLARANDATLRVIEVTGDFSTPVRLVLPQSVRDLVLRDRRERLMALIEPLEREGLRVTAAALGGHHTIEIVREVLRGGHDLLMKVPSEEGRLHSRHFGPVDMKLLRKCPCPVWMVRPTASGRYGHVLAAIDPDPGDETTNALNTTIVELARSVARMEHGSWSIVHAWNVYAEEILRSKLSDQETDKYLTDVREGTRTMLDTFLMPWAEDIGPEQVHLIKGAPCDAIAELVTSEAIDLVVMGTHGRTGIAGFMMGNTAETVLSRAECSVLTVKPAGFVSPITA